LNGFKARKKEDEMIKKGWMKAKQRCITDASGMH